MRIADQSRSGMPVTTAAILLFLLVLLLSACGGGGGGGGAGAEDPDDVTGDPTAPPGTEFGSLRLTSVQAGFSALEILPDEEQLRDIDLFEIELTGPGLSQSASVAGNGAGDIATPVVFADLVPGTWTITVDGYRQEHGAAVLIVSGVASVEVAAGVEATAGVSVETYSDESLPGSWELTIRWPLEVTLESGTPEEHTVPADVTAARYQTWEEDGSAGAGGTLDGEAIVVEGESGSVTIGGTRPPGRFDLRVILESGTFPERLVHEGRWRVFSNIGTVVTEELSPQVFESGGGTTGITVSVAVPQDLHQFFEGIPESTVDMRDTFTITADVAGVDPGEDSYRWRLDGGTVPADVGSQGTRYTMPAAGDPEVDIPPGTVRTITLEVRVNGVWYSGSHRVRITDSA